ncbi:TetR/AcrR family transcriptional regulator C-terminal domain-containing protein [Selenomonas ruminantium]|uniref:Transcriptional regulator, TetR family n=1 Tax=Selenomonas ruminantium TaxID=971 RepID=A0A1H0U5N7_SELRU|nr:TetR/AcrR family transcriptional regulator C-terminal domain-containing protein [Selenomonas ruminantium]SDP61494.1 transcriptional regulator, TetR family [Selenomonas ruminantium]
MIIRQTTKELLAASLQELAQSKSMDKITIREITQNCQLTSTTFYNHFQDKYALLAWIYHRELTPLYERLGKDIDWNTLIRQGIIAVQQNKQFYRNAMKNTSGQTSFQKAVSDYFIGQIHNYICKQQGINELPEKLQFMIRFYVLGIFPFLCEWVLYHDEPPAKEFILLLHDAMPQELRPYLL